ncbi:hypothetical protein XENORESO_015332 [Xenotaenia resolanae]|uniref:Uncharacterized protein n=1 Tax=Xenotaenia resolanae TaxID=208358 RepID=A0ABV0WFU5_9TELE
MTRSLSATVYQAFSPGGAVCHQQDAVRPQQLQPGNWTSQGVDLEGPKANRGCSKVLLETRTVATHPRCVSNPPDSTPDGHQPKPTGCCSNLHRMERKEITP